MRSSLRRVLALGASLSLAGALAACSGTTGTSSTGMDGHGMSSAVQSTSAAAGRDGDVMFAQLMIPHHQQALEMAEIALAKTDISSEVRELASQVKQAQDPEIQTMSAWLQEWGAAAPTGSMDHDMGSGMMSAADMESLEQQATGETFDELWTSMMIEHHEGAIEMARAVLATTEDAEVKALADAIIKAQTEEISTMRSMS